MCGLNELPINKIVSSLIATFSKELFCETLLLLLTKSSWICFVFFGVYSEGWFFLPLTTHLYQ